MSTLIITLIALNILVLAAAREWRAGGWSRQLGLSYGMPAGAAAPRATNWLKSVNWNGDEGDKKAGGK